MARWEYAAVVRYELPIKQIFPDVHGNSKFKRGMHAMWALVQPGKELHLIVKPPHKKKLKPQTWEGKEKFVKIAYTWANPQTTRDELEKSENWNTDPEKTESNTKFQVNKESMPIILYEADDILRLVNIAGSDGWEITDGFRNTDTAPETKWSMMRRELDTA